jgi:hypothetical protein
MSKENRRLSYITGLLVTFLAAAAFWLSFAALRDLAIEQGVAPGVAWLYPAIIDGAIIVFSLSVVQVSLAGERPRYPWVLVGLFTVLSVALNMVHATTEALAKLMAAIPPVALFLSFELLMNQLKTAAQKQSLGETVAGLEQHIADRQAELDKIQAQIAAAEAAMQEREESLRQVAAGQNKGAAREKGRPTRVRKPHKAAAKRGRVSVSNGHLPPSNGQPPAASDQQSASSSQEEPQTRLLLYLTAHPQATLQEMIVVTGRAKSTVQRYVRQLQGQGQLTWSDTGWVVRPALVEITAESIKE